MFSGCYCSSQDLCFTISVSIGPSSSASRYQLFNCFGASGPLDPRTSWLDLWTESCTWHCYFSYLLMANSYRAAQRSFTACRNLAWNVNGRICMHTRGFLHLPLPTLQFQEGLWEWRKLRGSESTKPSNKKNKETHSYVWFSKAFYRNNNGDQF